MIYSHNKKINYENIVLGLLSPILEHYDSDINDDD